MVYERHSNQPLISRPAYGLVGTAALPEGDPGGKGLSENDVSGTKTFAKPVDDIREPTHDDESMYSVENADDLTKDQSQVMMDQRDHTRFRPSLGNPDPDATPKTKYPYRDDIPNAHNASAKMVVGMWLLDHAPELVLEAPFGARTATKMADIISGLNPKVVARSKTCTVSIKRADPRNMRWLFAVDSGNGPKLVRVKFTPKGNTTAVPKMALSLTCSCPAWQWLGSEHHAKREKYLDGRPRGTASVPVVRDPEGINRVCKHAAAALSFVENWKLSVRKK